MMSMVSSYVVYKWCGVETGGEPSLHPGLGHAHEGLYRMFRARGLVFHSGESSSLSLPSFQHCSDCQLCVSLSVVFPKPLSVSQYTSICFYSRKYWGG
jgi:hypothetical protein